MTDKAAERTLMSRLRTRLGPRAPWFDLALYVFARGQKDQFLRVAASLSYTSLIALVPLLAIAVAIFSAFPAFSEARGQFENFISQSMVPNAGQSVHVYLRQFINATGKLTTVGVVGLGATAVLTLITIETAFNAIFRVARQRPMLSRVLMYWAVLTLGPLLFGASSTLSGGLFAMRRALAGGAFDSISTAAGLFTPMLFSWIAFSLLYMAVPNRPVAWRDALIGGAVAAVLFALLRFGFSRFVASGNTYRTLYGALAVIPLFLLSMYLSWAVVLFGAVMTAALPEWRAHAAGGGESTGAAAEIGIALGLLAQLRAAQQTGRAARRRLLLAAAAAPESAVEGVLAKLKAAGFAERSEDGDWILTRDLAEVPMSALVAALGWGWSAESLERLPGAWRPALAAALGDSLAAEQTAWGMPVRSVVEARAGGE
ncbi:YihY family inner membrane protein [Oleispirillum naphthae]|uniref:YihY family inner membrane protein n=1 Tax=Oleispirillum naphthae TaxID=2838853 RepID=UPI0030825D5D